MEDYRELNLMTGGPDFLMCILFMEIKLIKLININLLWQS